MKCPYCNSDNVVVNAAITQKPVARHGCLYWIFIGWWLHLLLWIFATLPMIIWRLIRPNRKTEVRVHGVAVCQDCGRTWKT